MDVPDKDHFADTHGNLIEDSPEPLPCAFCGSGADWLVVERWSAEGDPDASYHVERSKCGCQRPTSSGAARSCRSAEQPPRVRCRCAAPAAKAPGWTQYSAAAMD